MITIPTECLSAVGYSFSWISTLHNLLAASKRRRSSISWPVSSRGRSNWIPFSRIWPFQKHDVSVCARSVLDLLTVFPCDRSNWRQISCILTLCNIFWEVRAKKNLWLSHIANRNPISRIWNAHNSSSQKLQYSFFGQRPSNFLVRQCDLIEEIKGAVPSANLLYLTSSSTSCSVTSSNLVINESNSRVDPEFRGSCSLHL